MVAATSGSAWCWSLRMVAAIAVTEFLALHSQTGRARSSSPALAAVNSFASYFFTTSSTASWLQKSASFLLVFSPKARRPRAGWPQRLPEARNGWLGLKNKTCQLASWESCVFPLYYWKSWYGTIFFNDVSIFLMTMWKFILYTYYILSYCINYLRQLLIMSEHTRNGAIRLLEVCNIFCFFFLKYLVRWILKCWNLKDEL